MNIDIKWILGILGSLGAIIFYQIRLYKARQAGREEVINRQIDLDLQNITKELKQREKVQRENIKQQNALDNTTWDDVTKLRGDKKYSLQEVADALMRGKGE